MQRGFSLLEMVVALSLAALVLPLLLNLLPSSALTLKRAEDVSTASAYGYQLIEEARRGAPPAVGVDLSQVVTLNGTRFTVRREIFAVDRFDDMRDVVVTLQGPPRLQPVRIASRLDFSR